MPIYGVVYKHDNEIRNGIIGHKHGASVTEIKERLKNALDREVEVLRITRFDPDHDFQTEIYNANWDNSGGVYIAGT